MNNEKTPCVDVLRMLLGGPMRVLTADQISRIVGKPIGQVRRKLSELPEEEFHVVTTRHRLYPVGECLVRVFADDPEPDFAALSRKLIKRHNNSPVVTDTVVYATPELRARMSGIPLKLNTATLGHDIAVTEILIRLADADLRSLPIWTPEDALPHEDGETKPDGMIGDTVVIDYGGAYKQRRLRQIHNYCRDRGLTYEIY